MKKLLKVWVIHEEQYKGPTCIMEVEDDNWISWTNKSSMNILLVELVYKVMRGRYQDYFESSSSAIRKELIEKIKAGDYDQCLVAQKTNQQLGETTMGFSGYYRRLCKQGHLYENDAMADCEDFGFGDSPKWTCCFCGEEKAWEQLVDQTNDEGFCVELRVKTKAVTETCDKCNHTHQVSPTIYYAPTKEETDKQLKEWEKTRGYDSIEESSWEDEMALDS